MARLLIIEAPFYQDISRQLNEGACAALDEGQCEADFLQVSGALEIPTAIHIAHHSQKTDWDGYIALGCVIRGETSHYDIVAQSSAWGLMRLGTDFGLAIGNGILTVDNKAQAVRRASPKHGDKGGFAVRACLGLIAFRERNQ